jgi:hypothetical protein
MTANDAKAAVLILYTNYRGETSLRRVIPKGIRFAASEWHPEEKWLLDAFDIDKHAERSFAIKDIHEWRGSPDEQPQMFETGYRPKAG